MVDVNRNLDIIGLRVELLKLVYSPSYSVDDAVKKAKAMEDYILEQKTPSKDKVKA